MHILFIIFVSLGLGGCFNTKEKTPPPSPPTPQTKAIPKPIISKQRMLFFRESKIHINTNLNAHIPGSKEDLILIAKMLRHLLNQDSILIKFTPNHNLEHINLWQINKHFLNLTEEEYFIGRIFILNFYGYKILMGLSVNNILNMGKKLMGEHPLGKVLLIVPQNLSMEKLTPLASLKGGVSILPMEHGLNLAKDLAKIPSYNFDTMVILHPEGGVIVQHLLKNYPHRFKDRYLLSLNLAHLGGAIRDAGFHPINLQFNLGSTLIWRDALAILSILKDRRDLRLFKNLQNKKIKGFSGNFTLKTNKNPQLLISEYGI